MPEIQIRKKVTVLEEIFHEGGPPSAIPLRRAVALTVVLNPFAGRYVQEIAGFIDDLKPLALEMARSLVAPLGGNAKIIEGYGNGAIVGASRELAHCALSHTPARYRMRQSL